MFQVPEQVDGPGAIIATLIDEHKSIVTKQIDLTSTVVRHGLPIGEHEVADWSRPADLPGKVLGRHTRIHDRDAPPRRGIRKSMIHDALSLAAIGLPEDQYVNRDKNGHDLGGKFPTEFHGSPFILWATVGITTGRPDECVPGR